MVREKPCAVAARAATMAAVENFILVFEVVGK
jgi:hypothetical protein